MADSSSSESEFNADFSEEEFSSEDDNEHFNEAGHIEPYMYEPEIDSDDDDHDGNVVAGVQQDGEDMARLGNNTW